MKNYANNNQRRRDTIRRLAVSNFSSEHDKFLTLTFKENITDIKVANNLFKKFIMKLKYNYGLDKLKYLAVIEFQKRGAIHYHVLLHIPYIPHKELQELWGHGFVFINAIKHVDNLGAYILKYMTKDNEDIRLVGQKGYLKSRGLVEPRVFQNENIKDKQDADSFLKIQEQFKDENISEYKVYESSFDTEFLGTCKYKQYNFRRLKNDNSGNIG